MIKKLGIIVLLSFLFSLPVKAQFSESKERKRMWHKSKKRRKDREAFNPYLKKKKKDKPSSVDKREDDREQRRQLRAAKKKKKRNMKKLGYKEQKIKKR